MAPPESFAFAGNVAGAVSRHNEHPKDALHCYSGFPSNLPNAGVSGAKKSHETGHEKSNGKHHEKNNEKSHDSLMGIDSPAHGDAACPPNASHPKLN